MEDGNSNSSHSSLKQRSLLSLHKRVQDKLEKMQTKLEKSKSVDSLLLTCDAEERERNKDFATAHIIKPLKMVENEDSDEVKYIETQTSKESQVVEDIEMRDALLQDVDTFFIKCDPSGTIDSDDLQFNSHEEKSISSKSVVDDDLSKMSFELIEDFEGEMSDISIQTEPQKVSIRQRITQRINAAKEKRIVKSKFETMKKSKERDKVEKLILSNTTKQEARTSKTNVKVATVTIALIEATLMQDERPSQAINSKKQSIHCRIQLGLEKCKTKPVKRNGSTVEFSELVNLGLYEDTFLEISLWERDTPQGRTVLDLEKIQKEKTHRMNLKLVETPNTELFILLTITGTVENSTFESDDNMDTRKSIENWNEISPRIESKEDNGVGCLAVFVYGAMGLSANECCCILELDNDRLQTTTEYKTCDPNWMKMFYFVVTDVTSILEITVFDEKKSEDIGKLSIALLSINNGEKKWFALKDSTQRERAKGNNPRILIEMSLSWDFLKATQRVLNPKKVKYLKPPEKLDRHIFARNINRSKAIVNWVVDASKLFKTCFEWENKVLNFLALVLWLAICWCFKLWMVPLILIIPFIYYRPEKYYYINWKKVWTKLRIINDDRATKALELEIKKEKEEKASFFQKLNSLQDMVQSVQLLIGNVASFGERIKNLFNFTVPYLSSLVISLVLLVTLMLYFIPPNYIFMAWGIHKYIRKILRKNRIANNEVLDLISRVPDDDILMKCQELPLMETEEVVI